MSAVLIVEILSGKDGKCHIREPADFRVNRVADVVKMGDMIWVKILGLDERGKIKLPRKAAPAPVGANESHLRGAKSSAVITSQNGRPSDRAFFAPAKVRHAAHAAYADSCHRNAQESRTRVGTRRQVCYRCAEMILSNELRATFGGQNGNCPGSPRR